MDNDNTPSSLVMNYMVPTVTIDGNSIFLSNDGDIPTITFFQIRRTDGKSVYADAVASIRMSSLEELKNFQKSIGEAIENHQRREK